MTKRQALLLAPEIPVTGEGEDYFLTLFGDSKKLLPHSFHAEKAWKHFSMILEEVGQSRSSALGDIKIAEVNVKGLFVKLINSSLDKELEIGGHILQQNVNGQTLSLYRFPPNIIMQANCTITVWAAASEAKHQPPSDFLWREQNKFRTSPNCTTILCKPNGEAVAWYTPIHWKQAWEKLETDIEFDRRSVVSTTSRRHVFNWPAAITTTKEKQDKCNKDISKYQMEQVRVFLKREKETPPNPLPNSSPWCHSPSVPAHPYSTLIETCNTCMTGSSLDRQPRPQSSRPDPAQSLHQHHYQGLVKCLKHRPENPRNKASNWDTYFTMKAMRKGAHDCGNHRSFHILYYLEVVGFIDCWNGLLLGNKRSFVIFTHSNGIFSHENARSREY
ncbi:lamin tail domain-containing protein 1 isoform X7 [Halichoerus grypus]